MLKVEQLSRSHDRKRFSCGIEPLDTFLQKHARQHAERNISRTFVLVESEAPETIVAYYTLSVCEVIPAEIPDLRLQRYPHPIAAAKLARLAVTKTQQKKGLGKQILVNAMERTLSIAENAGIVGLFVDAKDETAAAFYKRYGFIETEQRPLILYLPMATIGEAFR